MVMFVVFGVVLVAALVALLILSLTLWRNGVVFFLLVGFVFSLVVSLLVLLLHGPRILCRSFCHHIVLVLFLHLRVVQKSCNISGELICSWWRIVMFFLACSTRCCVASS